MATNNSILYAAAFIAIGLLVMSFRDGNGNSISDTQLQQTASLEGFRSTAYPDGSSNGVQMYSIGYGHQIQPNEIYLLTATITEDQAQQLLLSDMQAIINQVLAAGLTLTQGQMDALTDFGYNAGSGSLAKVLTTFANSGADSAAAEMQQYIYWHPTPGGAAVVNNDLVNRRNIEISTFNS